MWYALYTAPRKEPAVSTYLSTNGEEVVCPTVRELVRKPVRGSGGTRHLISEVSLPAYPCYVFAKISDRLYGLLRDPPDKVGRVKVVSCGYVPSILSDELVDLLRDEMEVGGSFSHLAEGQQVLAGTLAGLIATITKVNHLLDRQEVSIAFSMFGKEVEVSVPALSVEAL